MDTHYFNDKNDIQYILHFPGQAYNLIKNKVEKEIDRDIFVNENISIVSVMNAPCYEDSILVKQLKHNNIKLYDSKMAYEVKDGEWFQPNKLDYILEALENVKTKYVAILDGRDVAIVNNLDNEFINKFLNLDTPFIYNGAITPFPTILIEPPKVRLRKETMKYINAGVCFGYTEELIKFYKFCKDIRDNDEILFEYPQRPTGSEQFFIRLGLLCYNNGEYLLKAVDADRKLFTCLQCFNLDKDIDLNTDKVILKTDYTINNLKLKFLTF